jgi:flagellar protein FlgJ
VTVDPMFGPGFSGLTERAQLERAARELESVVVNQLFTTMRKSVPKSGLVEESPATEMFRSMLDTELARVAAEKSPFGLADAIVARFTREDAVKPGSETAEAPSKDTAAALRPGFRRIG